MRIGRERSASYLSDFFVQRNPYWNPPVPALTTVQTSSGITVTGSATINTKGSWTEIISSTTGPGDILRLTCDIDVSATNTAALIDIGFGAAASESAVMSNLAVGAWSSVTVDIPLKIAQGTRVAARLQGAVASRAATITVAVVDSGSYILAPASVDVLGTSTATSLGTALTGSTIIEITASTSKAYSSLIGLVSSSDTVMAAATNFYAVGTGASGSEVWNYVNLFTLSTAEQITYPYGMRSLQQVSSYASVGTQTFPSGTRVAMIQNNAADTIHGCVIGVPLP